MTKVASRHLIIRADANSNMGMGHVMRCIALAQEWLACGGRATMISHLQHDAVRARIRSAGIDLVELSRPHPDEFDVAKALDICKGVIKAGPNQDGSWIVLDGYHLDADYQDAIRGAGCKVLAIDDRAHLPRYNVDVLLNQNLKSEHLPYCCDPGTVMLLGTRYALLRPEFAEWRGFEREAPDLARKVLVTIGGSDYENATLKVILALKAIEVPDLQAKVVVGPANPHIDTLTGEVEGCAEKIQLLTTVADMSGLMAWADVAVSAGGSTCWELAYMGLPSLIMETADNQRDIAEGLSERGVAINLGWHEDVTVDQIGNSLMDLCNDAESRADFSKQGRMLVDGDGAKRVVELLGGFS